MRYALASVLLLGCSGNAFTGTPPEGTGGTGGTVSSGGAASGGTTQSGGSGGKSGSLPDASLDGPALEVPDGSSDAPAEADAPQTSCPASPPSTSSCSGTFDCTYGDDARVSCRPVYQCRNGKWLLSAKQCPPAKYCSEFAVPPVNGAPCATKDAYCTYAGGDDCGCVQGPTLSWTCVPKPPAPCPRKAANKGQVCAGGGEEDPDAGTCSYGFCGSPEHVQTACTNRVTTWTPACN